MKTDYTKRDVTMKGEVVKKLCWSCLFSVDVIGMLTSFIETGACSKCQQNTSLATVRVKE